MIVSSLYDWLGQLRYATENYDGSVKKLPQVRMAEEEESERNVREVRKFLEELPPGFKIPRVRETRRRLKPKPFSGSRVGRSLDSIVDAVDEEVQQVHLRQKRFSLDYSQHRKAFTDALTIKSYVALQDLHTIPEIPEKENFISKFYKRWKSNQNLLKPTDGESLHKVKSCDAVNTLDVKHGELRPVSVLFEESVQEFDPPPPASVRCKLNITNDSIFWLKELQTTCHEEEDYLESHLNICGFGLAKETLNQRKTIVPKVSGDKKFSNLSRVNYEGKTIKLSKTDEIRITNGEVILHNEKGKEETKLMDCFYVKTQKDTEKDHIILQDEQQREIKLTKQNPRSLLQIFLRRRVTQNELELRGIYKNETIFGNTLVQLHQLTKNPVPEFITRVIELIELPKNIVSEGIYRTSGNTATIQSVRIKVDNNQLKVLQDHQDDPDVLAGSLKLFFRELKESIISQQDYNEMRNILESGVSDEEKYEKVGDVISRMHVSHRETLRVVMEHLLRVCSHVGENQMTVESMSVCWGQSIISFLEQSHDLINEAKLKNRVVELVLNSYGHSYGPRIGHTESMRSIQSVQSLQLKSIHGSTSDSSFEKLTGSTPCLSTGNIILEIFGIIESKKPLEGVYEKPGNRKKTDKIFRKATKDSPSKQLKQIINRKSTTVYDLADFLKRYFNTKDNLKIDVEFLMELDSKSDPSEEVKRYLQCNNTLQLLFEHLNVVVRESQDSGTALYNVTKNWLGVLAGVGQPDPRFDRCRFAMEKVLKAFDRRHTYTRTNSLYAPRENVIVEYEPT